MLFYNPPVFITTTRQCKVITLVQRSKKEHFIFFLLNHARMKRIHNIYEPIFCIRRDWLNGHELFFHLVNSLIRIKIARIAIIKIPINKLIQMGDNTHHQDQLITLHNLRPINRIVRAPVKPMPEEDDDELEVMRFGGRI